MLLLVPQTRCMTAGGHLAFLLKITDWLEKSILLCKNRYQSLHRDVIRFESLRVVWEGGSIKPIIQLNEKL
jgi:hypothetical protein